MAPIPRNLESSGSEYRASERTGSEDSSSAYSEDITADQDGREYLPHDPRLVFRNQQGDIIRPFRGDSEDRYTRHTEGAIGMRVSDARTQGTNTTRGIWAGRFHSPYQPPLSRNDPDFVTAAMNHLWRVKKSSPFISIWLTPLPAIHRLIRSKTANITFLNVDYLGEDDTEYSIIHPAGNLIKQYRLRSIGFPDGTVFRYVGGSEYLVWQHIESHAIVCTMSRADFDLHCEENPDLKKVLSLDILAGHKWAKTEKRAISGRVLCNLRVGYAIGRLLNRARIPRRFVEKFGKVFASNFKFFGLRRRSNQEQYPRGVWKGFWSSQEDHISTPTPKTLWKEPIFAGEVNDHESPSVKAKRTRVQRVTQKKSACNSTRVMKIAKSMNTTYELSQTTQSDFSPRAGPPMITNRKPLKEQSRNLNLKEQISKEEPVSKICSFATELINNFSPPTTLPTPPRTSPPTANRLGNSFNISTAELDVPEVLDEAGIVGERSQSHDEVHEKETAPDQERADTDNGGEDNDADSDSETLVGEPSDVPYLNDSPKAAFAPGVNFHTFVQQFQAPGYESSATTMHSQSDTEDKEDNVVYLGTKRKFSQTGEGSGRRELIEEYDDFMRSRRWIEAYLEYPPYRQLKRARKARGHREA